MFEIVGKLAGLVEDVLELCVGAVAGDDDCASESESCGDWIFFQRLEGFLHAEVEVDRHAFEFPIAEFFRDETTGIFFEFFDEDSVLGDFRFRLAVGRAGDADADRT